MEQFLLGFQALLRVWSDAAFAQRIRSLLTEPAPAPSAEKSPPREPVAPPPPTPVPSRSDAVALLSVLQREGRLLDFLRESISAYSDAEIGAAVRPVHKDCAAAVERIFGVEPLLPQEEGATVEIPPGHDPARYRVIGSIAGGGPLRGTVVHPGWRATRCDLPTWTGKLDTAMVLAPAEVEL